MPKDASVSSRSLLAKLLKALRRRATIKEFCMGVPADTLRRHPSTLPFADSLGAHLHPLSTWRGCLSETYSFLRRIRFALRTQIYRRLVIVDAGHLGQTWAECQRIQNACTADINKLSGPRPWLTLVDTESLSQAWMMGATWYAHNAVSLNIAYSSSVLDSYQHPPNPSETLTPTIVAQDSTRDPSDPLPLRASPGAFDGFGRNYKRRHKA